MPDEVPHGHGVAAEEAGSPHAPADIGQERATLSVISLVLGILGIFPLGPPASISAIVCGHKALSRFRKAGVRPGRAIAVAGLITGYAGVALQTLLVAVALLLLPAWRLILPSRPCPLSYEFVIEPQAGGQAGDLPVDLLPRLQSALAGRLGAARVPFEFDPAAQACLRLRVGLPGKVPVEQIRSLIVAEGRLEFRLVHKDSAALVAKLFDAGISPDGYWISQSEGLPCYVPAHFVGEKRPDTLSRLRGFRVPDAQHEFMLEEIRSQSGKVYEPHFVKRTAEMTGERIESARVDCRGPDQPVVLLAFDAEGAKDFAELTMAYAPGGSENPDPGTNRRLAIVVDGKMYSAPVIREAIQGGRAEISGRFSPSEATLLASVLQAGTLPCPVRIVTEGSFAR
jgi:hypothetical protein